ncbi:MAG: hypothetical protein J6R07_05355 [Bacteroidaceae bacterium]|nr:hypothetical protein [Bacteroidaceae bacterium]
MAYVLDEEKITRQFQNSINECGIYLGGQLLDVKEIEDVRCVFNKCDIGVNGYDVKGRMKLAVPIENGVMSTMYKFRTTIFVNERDEIEKIEDIYVETL